MNMSRLIREVEDGHTIYIFL